MVHNRASLTPTELHCDSSQDPEVSKYKREKKRTEFYINICTVTSKAGRIFHSASHMYCTFVSWVLCFTILLETHSTHRICFLPLRWNWGVFSHQRQKPVKQFQMPRRLFAAWNVAPDFLAPWGQGQICPWICENTALVPAAFGLSAPSVLAERHKWWQQLDQAYSRWREWWDRESDEMLWGSFDSSLEDVSYLIFSCTPRRS